jgi:hypothetical protein
MFCPFPQGLPRPRSPLIEAKTLSLIVDDPEFLGKLID